MVLFLLAILASFAIADIGNVRSGTFGIGGGNLVKVGDEKITDRDMSTAMQRALNRLRQQSPEATYSDLAGQFEPLLESIIDDRALLAFAADHGFMLSKRLIDAEIAGMPQNRGLDGKFNEQAYAAFLQQQQMSDAEVRQLLRVAITQRLILAPAAVDAKIPLGVARPYASMLLEERQGQMALVPSSMFRAGLNPSDGDLQSFYTQNRNRYMIAEQRVLKIAKVGPETVANIVPTEAEIAAYYKSNQAQYAGSETRVISQAVVQDKKQADGIAARARGGAAFAAAAAPAGLSAEDVSIGPQTRAEFTGLAGDQIAAAAFGAGKGAIVGPVKSDLGWHVIKIDDVRGASGRTLAQAHDEIAALLTTNKRKEALTDLVTRLEDQIADGASFAEAVAAAKLTATTTPPINSGGAARSDAAFKFPAEMQPVLQAGFGMDADSDPEVVTLPNDAGYALVAVDRVIEAAPAPLAEIKGQVRGDWINRKAADRARAVADGIGKKVASGTAIEKAVTEAGVSLPPVQTITARRLQIAQTDPSVVAPLRMMFSLAQGKSRMVADPRGRGFFVVKTNRITPGDAMTNPILVAQTQAEFQRAVSDELGQQLVQAMRADQGVTRNDEAIAAAKQRITGSGQ